ncbi:LytTR family transcriptional regulator DNA-binding domain-containing protein [Solitalea canadensis]|uniref:LytTR family transcriptional regulator DNA-binding domain-containing protein n=1 Tax=Solitalea canadensis TaxID=995 RepID=UPI00024733BD
MNLLITTSSPFHKSLPAKDFLHVHKSFIINLNQLQAIKGSFVQIRDKQISVSRTYREALLKK